MNQRRVSADKINSNRSGSLIDGPTKIDGIAARTLGQNGNWRDGDAFVGDANANLVANFIDRADKT